MKKIKEYIKEILLSILSLFPLNNKKILFESNSEIKDNSKSLFNECIKNKLNDKYKLIWFVENPNKYKEKYSEYKNVKLVKKNKLNSYSILFLYHCCTAKYCFYTHKFIGLRTRPGQVKVFLTHGIPIKNSTGLFWNPYLNTDIISTSDFAAKLRCKTFNGGNDIVRLLGFPRNDNFFEKDEETVKYYNELKCSKMIIWLPTFKHWNVKKVNRNDFASEQKNDISILSDLFLEKVNNLLKEKNAILFIKFHPGQNLDYIKFYDFSNIIMMSNKQLDEKNIDLYSLMAESSALITDFSSVYIDYLLLNKPIGFELGDFKQYEKGRGFLVENPLEYMPGYKIINEEDFLKFLNSVFDEEDEFIEQREELKEKMHKFKDGKSSERILKEFGLL